MKTSKKKKKSFDDLIEMGDTDFINLGIDLSEVRAKIVGAIATWNEEHQLPIYKFVIVGIENYRKSYEPPPSHSVGLAPSATLVVDDEGFQQQPVTGSLPYSSSMMSSPFASALAAAAQESPHLGSLLPQPERQGVTNMVQFPPAGTYTPPDQSGINAYRQPAPQPQWQSSRPNQPLPSQPQWGNSNPNTTPQPQWQSAQSTSFQEPQTPQLGGYDLGATYVPLDQQYQQPQPMLPPGGDIPSIEAEGDVEYIEYTEPCYGFAPSTYNVNAKLRQVVLTIKRNHHYGDSYIYLSTTDDGTAQAGRDFQHAVNEPIIFANGSDSVSFLFKWGLGEEGLQGGWGGGDDSIQTINFILKGADGNLVKPFENTDSTAVLIIEGSGRPEPLPKPKTEADKTIMLMTKMTNLFSDVSPVTISGIIAREQKNVQEEDIKALEDNVLKKVIWYRDLPTEESSFPPEVSYDQSSFKYVKSQAEATGTLKKDRETVALNPNWNAEQLYSSSRGNNNDQSKQNDENNNSTDVETPPISSSSSSNASTSTSASTIFNPNTNTNTTPASVTTASGNASTPNASSGSDLPPAPRPKLGLKGMSSFFNAPPPPPSIAVSSSFSSQGYVQPDELRGFLLYASLDYLRSSFKYTDFMNQNYVPHASHRSSLSSSVCQEVASIVIKQFETSGETKFDQKMVLQKLITATDTVMKSLLALEGNKTDDPSVPKLWSEYEAYITSPRIDQMSRSLLIEDLTGLYNLSDKERSLYGVIDGCGGTQSTEFISVHLPANIVRDQSFVLKSGGNDLNNIIKAIENGFIQTGDMLMSRNNQDGTKYGGICSVLLINGKDMYIAWLGSSLAYLYKAGKTTIKDGNLSLSPSPLTKRAVGKIESIGMSSDEDMIDDWLSNPDIVGNLDLSANTAKPHVNKLNVEGDEYFVVLGSRGFWKLISPEIVAEHLSKYLLQKSQVPLSDYLVGQAKMYDKNAKDLSLAVIKFAKRV